MTASFEELDYCQSALGELILRRRRPVSMPDLWVYEVKLAGNFLMSSLVRTSEEALAELALTRLAPPEGDQGHRVLVGGLGLGYTAAQALATPGVGHVEVIEFLPEVISWHERDLVPLGAPMRDDPRCRIVQGDFFGLVRGGLPDPVDAMLIDIDDGPEELLSEEHGAFYSVEGLRKARQGLRPGGVIGVWTSRACNEPFLDRLREAFGNGEPTEITFHNPLLSIDEVNTIYLAFQGA